MPSPRCVYVGVLIGLCALPAACERRQQAARRPGSPARPPSTTAAPSTQPARPTLTAPPATVAAAPAATRPATQTFARFLSDIYPKDEDAGWLWPVVSTSLRHPDAEVRVAAVALAGRLTPDLPSSARGLIERAYDLDPNVRVAATQVLGRLRLPRPPEPPDGPAPGGTPGQGTAEYLRTHPPLDSVPEARRAEMEALISAVLNASQPEVRRQADALLPAYGEEAYAWLVSLLHNTSPPVRSNVIAALDAFAAAGPPRPAPPELLRVIARPHERDRDEAVALLARLSPRDPQTWSLLLKVAATPTEWVSLNRKLEARQVASAALSEHAGDPAVALQLAHAVLDNRLAPTAAEAFEHAGDAAAAGAVPALLSVLPDATPNTQVRVLAVIASFGPAARDATGKLQDLLRSPDSSVRIAAAEALAAIGPDAASAGPALAERLGDPDLHVRSAAASALLRTGPGDHDLAADLLAAVRRKDRTLCTILAPSVKLDGATGKRVRPQLADLARHDPDEATRTLAWTALHDMGDPLRWRYSDRRAEGE